MSREQQQDRALSTGGVSHLSAPRGTPELLWFYCLWITLALLSAALGHSSLSAQAGLFLLGGITSTNFFFMAVARSEPNTEGLMRLLATYQTIMGIAWTSAYFYFAAGAGDLVLGMYMTLLMFAVFHLELRTVLLLGSGALLSYLAIVGINFVTLPALVSPLQDGLRFLVLAAIFIGIMFFARRLRDVRSALEFRNDELQTTVERVTRIAEEDHLTKSYNRRYIMDMLARERARADRSGGTFAVLLFDLDHFKRVNDEHGHLVGDQILTDFALRVKRELRGMDTINPTEHKRSFGRFGGEEFIALLPGTDMAGAEGCAERIRRLIAGYNFRDDCSITVSVGVAEYEHGETVAQMLTRADEALYRAKRDGRNRVRCSFSEHERTNDTTPNLRVLK